jgi:hypothetical protein
MPITQSTVQEHKIKTTMKKNLLFGALALAATSLIAAPKDDVTAAAKKLADSSYSWKSTTDMGANAQFTPGPTEGKIDKEYTYLSTSFGDNTMEAVKKGEKIAVKGESGWELADLQAGGGGGGGGGGFNPGTFAARRLQNLKAPAAEIEDLVSKTKELKQEGDVISGELTEDGAKALLTAGRGGFGRRGGAGGGQGPQAQNAKGSIKIWMKDGAITKYETKSSGKMAGRDGQDIDIDRTTTTEIKDMGKAITVPEDAKKKLS